MSVGVVLGAGGPLGWAFHLGVIEGVRSAINREPANADRIVGTSAGAAIAAAVVGGATTDDVLEAIDISPTADERELMRSAGAEALRHPLRSLRPLAPNLLANARRTGLATASVGLLPAGLFPTVPLRRFVAAGSSGGPRSCGCRVFVSMTGRWWFSGETRSTSVWLTPSKPPPQCQGCSRQRSTMATAMSMAQSPPPPTQTSWPTKATTLC